MTDGDRRGLVADDGTRTELLQRLRVQGSGVGSRRQSHLLMTEDGSKSDWTMDDGCQYLAIDLIDQSTLLTVETSSADVSSGVR